MATQWENSVSSSVQANLSERIGRQPFNRCFYEQSIIFPTLHSNPESLSLFDDDLFSSLLSDGGGIFSLPESGSSVDAIWTLYLANVRLDKLDIHLHQRRSMLRIKIKNRFSLQSRKTIGTSYTIENRPAPPMSRGANRERARIRSEHDNDDEHAESTCMCQLINSRSMSTIPNDFVGFLVPLIQEFDGVVEQVRYADEFLEEFSWSMFCFRHRQLAVSNCLTALNDG